MATNLSNLQTSAAAVKNETAVGGNTAERVGNALGYAASCIEEDRSSITDLQTSVNSKQNQLVSGENIKTINGNSLIGSGNIDISGGGGGSVTVDSDLSSTSKNPVQNKVINSALGNKVDKENGTLVKGFSIENEDGDLCNVSYNKDGGITIVDELGGGELNIPTNELTGDDSVAMQSQVTQLAQDLGNLDDLETSVKTDLVSAINEVAESGGGGGTETFELIDTITPTASMSCVLVSDVSLYKKIIVEFNRSSSFSGFNSYVRINNVTGGSGASINLSQRRFILFVDVFSGLCKCNLTSSSTSNNYLSNSIAFYILADSGELKMQAEAVTYDGTETYKVYAVKK